jgi:hypothetical protein
MSDKFASVNTKLSTPEVLVPSAKALQPVRTLTGRNIEPNGAASSGPDLDEVESNVVGVTEATEFSYIAHAPSRAIHQSVN